MLDPRRLEVLVTAARSGSLAAGARALGLTPSAASQAVAALEAHVGCPLLARHGRGVRPTAAGERLVLRAQGILADLAAAEDEVRGRASRAPTLAAPPTVVAGWAPGVLARWRRQCPDLALGILEAEGATALAAVRDGEADVAVVDHHAHTTPSDTAAGAPLAAIVLVDEPVLVWLPRGHPRAGDGVAALAELKQETWIASPPGSPCWDLLARACASVGFAPRVASTVTEYRSAAALVAAGIGVSIVPRVGLGAACGAPVVALPTTPPVTRRLTALVPPGPRPSELRTLLAVLQDEATKPAR